MLRRTLFAFDKQAKVAKGKMFLMSSFQRKRAFKKKVRATAQTHDGELIKGRGTQVRRQMDGIVNAIDDMQDPLIWIWYPWQRNPDSPQYDLGTTRALKNLHGAVYTDLTPKQKKLEEKWMYGSSIPAARDQEHEKKHPFLSKISKDLDGQAKGFPFWYKKYPSRRFAYEYRFNIPKEMLDGYSDDVKQALGRDMMSARDRTMAEKARYTERYGEHPLDVSSPAVRASQLAMEVRYFRNHMLTNPHNIILKMKLARKERLLAQVLRKLRKLNFKHYWELIRDHDIQDVIQPANVIQYRWGAYWRYDWNHGSAISTNIADFMDPRGMNGCIETGRSRAEVARDLGLSYTRTLNEGEKKQLSTTSAYYEQLQNYKNTQPEAWREKTRTQFTRKFSSVFAKMSRKSQAYDFPSTYRADVGTRYLRWKSARHGPM